MEQRAATHFVRALMSEQLMIQIARSRPVWVHGDIEATHQGFTSGGRKAHVGVEADQQQTTGSDFAEPLFQARSRECSENILLKHLFGAKVGIWP
ncbi:MAG TPA: hypothetical protein VGM02_06325 [Acidobacteriaceae bacterium]